MKKDLPDTGVRSLTFENCEFAAQMMRERAGLDNVEPVPAISSVLTHLGLWCVVRADHELEGHEAFAKPSLGEIHLRQGAYERLLEDEEGVRFLASHEAAHCFFHSGQTRFFKMTGGNILLPFLSEDTSVEIQADRIARAFLMPKQMVDLCADARSLATRARVLVSEAIDRVKDLAARSARTTPASIDAAIERQKEMVRQSSGLRASESLLDPVTATRLAWELAPLAEGLPSDEFRSIEGRYFIRWSRLDKMVPGGWRVSGGKIIPWESEVPS